MPQGAQPDKPKRSLIREYFWTVVWAILLALLLRAEVVGAYHIPSPSMEPTLVEGDLFLANKLSYGLRVPFSGAVLLPFGEPERGDVVVFASPLGSGPDWIKRIMALPGEQVAVRGRQVLINGQAIKDPWGFFDPSHDGHRPSFGPVTVPAGKYFVMGDNRDNSHDSRFWNAGQGGFVPRADLRGKAMVIVLSWQGAPEFLRWGRLGHLVR